jgi:hypothetical protein
MRISRTNFDRQESRRDRRYSLPPLTVAIGDQEYATDNWSLGGFQLTADLPLGVGAVVTGTFQLDRSDGFEFTAQVVRKDEPVGTLGFRFEQLTPQALTKLDRVLARRLVSRRRP